MEILKLYNTLYKRDKNNKLRFWKLQAVKIDDKFWIDINYGQDGGKIVENKKEIKEGKNKGKKNETSTEQQCILICDKTFKDKIEKEGYIDRKEDNIKKDIKFSPMLADTWNPQSKINKKIDIVFPCYCQPKLDGIRCLTYIKNEKTVNQSRQLKYFKNLDHINNELIEIFKDFPNLVLDGELYNHDISFNQIAGIVKKEHLKDVDRKNLLNIQYHVYDCFFISEEHTFSERLKFLLSLKKLKYINIVRTYVCESKEELINNHHRSFIECNYEGTILRNQNSKYEFNRSKNLQKYKSFIDNEFEIVGYKEGSGHDAETVIWKCKTNDDKFFDVRPKGTVQERKELLKNAELCIGKMLTIRYQELSEFGIPRFPVGIIIRDYE